MQHSADMRMGQAVDAVATNCLHSSQFESGFKARIFYSTHYYGLRIERVYGKRLNREQTSRLFHFKSGFKSGFFSLFGGALRKVAEVKRRSHGQPYWVSVGLRVRREGAFQRDGVIIGGEGGAEKGLPDLMDFMPEEELSVEMPRYSLDGFSVEGERSGSRVDALFT